jgi:replication factor C subunit 2/4
MTASAQQALRRTMEIYSSTTRFALACNNSTKIIEPIQSRCAVLRYTRLSDAEILSRLIRVAQEESVSYETSGLEAIIFTAEGDMRNALNAMQSTVSGFNHISQENVFRVCDVPHPLKIKEAIEKCRKGEMADAVDIVMKLWSSGYAGTHSLTHSLTRSCLLTYSLTNLLSYRYNSNIIPGDQVIRNARISEIRVH